MAADNQSLHKSNNFCWLIIKINNYCSWRMEQLLENCQSWCSLHVEVFVTFLQYFYIKRQKHGATLMRGDTSSSTWFCVSYNGTKYMIPKHAFKPGISWDSLLIIQVSWLMALVLMVVLVPHDQSVCDVPRGKYLQSPHITSKILTDFTALQYFIIIGQCK